MMDEWLSNILYSTSYFWTELNRITDVASIFRVRVK